MTSNTPADALPGIKPLKELGLKDYEIVSWQAVYAPAGTPQPIVDKLHKVMYAALQKPEVQERLNGMGMTISGAGPVALRDLLANHGHFRIDLASVSRTAARAAVRTASICTDVRYPTAECRRVLLSLMSRHQWNLSQEQRQRLAEYLE